MKTDDALFEGLIIGKGQVKGDMIIYPLTWERGNGKEPYYHLLHEALKDNLVIISEVSEDGDVNYLYGENRGDKPVLILDGEELIGAKQNRILNTTILIPAQSKIEIPVSCIERGRWNYRSREFEGSQVYGYSKIRKQKAKQVAKSIEEGMGFSADQNMIWNEIDRKQINLEAESATDALHDVYDKYEDSMNELTENLNPIEGQVGVIVFIKGSFSCLDLFYYPQTLESMWKKLLKSYAMEALEGKKEEKTVEAADVLPYLKRAKVQNHPSVGQGMDLRISGENIIGAGLMDDDKLLHLALFPDVEERDIFSKMSRPSFRRWNLEN